MTVATIETDDYLTTEEAAAVLGLSMDSVRRYLNNALTDDPNARPKLIGTSIGRTWLIHKDEVERYQRDRKNRGRPKNE